MPATDEVKLLQMLEWYQEMGVCTLVEELPMDWMRGAGFASSSFLELEAERRQKKSLQRLKSVSVPAANPSSLSSFAQGEAGKQNRFPLTGYKESQHLAGELARKATDIMTLKESVIAFEGCALKVTAHKTCFSDGNPNADLMIIGEAPGRDEDRAGLPFVGRAGKLLDKMIAAIGLQRQEDCYITNTVYWRPPGNRAPTMQEMLICLPFLHRQIEFVQPKVILVMGGSAAKSLLDVKEGIMRLRGKWKTLEVGGRSYDLLPSLHPSYLLRTPLAKRLAYRDFLMVQERLER